MTEQIERLEQRIDELRVAIRAAASQGDHERKLRLRRDLEKAEQEWEEALADLESEGTGRTRRPTRSLTPPPRTAPTTRRTLPILPLREQVHHVLTLLTVPTAARMIVAVHKAFFAGEILPQRLTSLRRDEERSFRTAPHARPYYLCPALSAELLSPARGLLTVSTWTLPERIVGPLSPRVNYLISARKVAEYIQRLEKPSAEAIRLLGEFAANIPGAGGDGRAVRPEAVIKAAREELKIHELADQEDRDAAAERAQRLDVVDQLFGNRLIEVGDVEEVG